MNSHIAKEDCKTVFLTTLLKKEKHPGGGVPRDSSGGDDRRIFSNPGFFWVGKFGKYLFWGVA